MIRCSNCPHDQWQLTESCMCCESKIMARCMTHGDGEGTWTLAYREWKVVEPAGDEQ
jgi:hypothetical protein